MNATCIDKLNDFECVCKPGFGGDGINCYGIILLQYVSIIMLIVHQEINECENHNCSVNATCIDLLGEFKCVCNQGHHGDGYSCPPITGLFFYCLQLKIKIMLIMLLNTDLCNSNTDCGGNATCSNEAGFFECKCNEGFQGDGYSCTGKRLQLLTH